MNFRKTTGYNKRGNQSFFTTRSITHEGRSFKNAWYYNAIFLKAINDGVVKLPLGKSAVVAIQQKLDAVKLELDKYTAIAEATVFPK